MAGSSPYVAPSARMTHESFCGREPAVPCSPVGVVIEDDPQAGEDRQGEGDHLVARNGHAPERVAALNSVEGGAVQGDAGHVGVREIGGGEVTVVEASAGEFGRPEVGGGEEAGIEQGAFPGRHAEVRSVEFAVGEANVLEVGPRGEDARQAAPPKLDPHRGELGEERSGELTILDQRVGHAQTVDLRTGEHSTSEPAAGHIEIGDLLPSKKAGDLDAVL